jgi:hypothetical protein
MRFGLAVVGRFVVVFARSAHFTLRGTSMQAAKHLILALYYLMSGYLLSAGALHAEETTTAIDLATIADGKDWKLVGRTVSVLDEAGKKGIRFKKAMGMGGAMAWLPKSNFGDGTIELDLRGEDVRQQSFLGIAFRIPNGAELSYEVVWFRPFNFKSSDAERRVHSVQYAAYPKFPWNKLRKDKPGVYESAVNPVPDPAGWFHAKIEINQGKVRVYVNEAATPCLVVDRLLDRQAGAIGLWVGNDSGGDFANLKFKRAL